MGMQDIALISFRSYFYSCVYVVYANNSMHTENELVRSKEVEENVLERLERSSCSYFWLVGKTHTN